MAEIIWTKKAEKDLQLIHEYISEDSVFYASRFIKKIITLVEVLNKFPTSGRVVPEKEDLTIRELIEGNYRIFYKHGKGNVIYILRIHHAARNLK
jgi:plasmid stabilization system protein ParE